MNLPTFLGALIVLAVFIAIIGRAVYNRKHHRGGCGCGCEGCANSGVCHPK